ETETEAPHAQRQQMQGMHTYASICHNDMLTYLLVPFASLCSPFSLFLSSDCFDNIAKLEFTTEPASDPSLPPVPTKTAIGMYSKEGEEYVPLVADFHCQGAVEEWLNRLVTA